MPFLIVVGAYLFASLPHLRLLCRIKCVPPQGDLHHQLWQKAGPVWGIIGVSGDVLKGLLPVWLAKSIGLDIGFITVCGLAAVAGQMWPVFDRFNGEKGNTTGLGVAFALAWLPMLIGTLPMLAGVLSKLIKLLQLRGTPVSSRFRTGAGHSNLLPVGVAVGFLLMPVAAALTGEPPAITAGLAVLWVLIMVRRLTADLSVDIRNKENLAPVFLNRALYDRSH